MRALTQEQTYNEWVKFYTVFEKLGLTKHYDMDKLKEEMSVSPCAVSDEMGTAYKGALLVHVNMAMAMAQRIATMISGTFEIDEKSLLKIVAIMHLSKRLVYVENDNDWEIKNRGLNFKFAKGVEGCLKGGARSALEALNNGVKLTPTEYEAITCLDDTEDTSKKSFLSIYSTVVRQANELAYAVEKERYNKVKNAK